MKDMMTEYLVAVLAIITGAIIIVLVYEVTFGETSALKELTNLYIEGIVK